MTAVADLDTGTKFYIIFLYLLSKIDDTEDRNGPDNNSNPTH